MATPPTNASHKVCDRELAKRRKFGSARAIFGQCWRTKFSAEARGEIGATSKSGVVDAPVARLWTGAVAVTFGDRATISRSRERALRSISTLIKNQGIGDLYRIYATTKHDGIDFNRASIPPGFHFTTDEPF